MARSAIGLGQAALMTGVCTWVVNLGYGMLPDWQRLKDYEFVSPTLVGPPPARAANEGRLESGNRFRGGLIGKFIVPLPIDYLRGLDRRLLESQTRAPAMDGERQDDQPRKAFSIVARVPLAMWGMLFWAAGLTMFRLDSVVLSLRGVIPWASIGLIGAAMVLLPRVVPIDKGLVLAAPFAIIAVSRLGLYFTLRRWWFCVVVILLTSWTLVSSLVESWGGRPYVNEAFGGSSNFQAQLAYGPGDGGSDLMALKAWVDGHPEASPVKLAVRHAVDLKPFGLTGDLSGAGEKSAAENRASRERRLGLYPGYYALEVGALRSKTYSHFQTLQPVAQTGTTIAVYHVTKAHAQHFRHDLSFPPLDTPAPAPVEGRGFVHRIFSESEESRENSHYTVFVPYSYEGDRPYPLILFLHGGGDAGMEGDQYLKVGLPPAIEARKESFNMIVVFPGGRTGNWQPGSWDAKRAMAILDRVQRDYLVDRKRIYLTGLSSGGTGVWALAEHYPDRWAAIVAVATAGCNPIAAPRIKNIPCWCFHNVNDEGSPPDAPRAMIAALRRAGGEPRYSEFFSPTTTREERHNAWDAAYGNPELYEWLLTHRLP